MSHSAPEPADRPLLETNDLCRYFERGGQEIRAVDRVSLKVMSGEFLGLVGASGSGKSTLLALMAGLDTPTAGSMAFDGRALAGMDRRQLASYRADQVGMVFQSFNLIPHLTAVQNVELSLYFTDTPRSERKRLAAEALSQIGLAERLEHRPADLSGGEQQRVALARALVKKPRLLFADEPTGNLDFEATEQTARLLRDLNDAGTTIVMVTHDLDLARNCTGRTIRLVYGRIAEDPV